MRKNNEYISVKVKNYIENYKGIDISYTPQNGFEIAGYWYTFRTLESARKIIDIRLNKDMKVSQNRGLIFAELLTH